MSITLTPNAVAELGRVIREQGLDPSVTGLRVSYVSSGHAVQRYGMELQEFRDAPVNGDESLVAHGIPIRCGQKDYRHIQGITIDFQEKEGQRGFVFTRPPAKWPLRAPFATPWLAESLRRVMDPEVGLNIVDLGLIYETRLEDDRVTVIMTMTTPACPMTEMICADVTSCVTGAGHGVRKVQIDLVWDPPWTRDMISEEGRSQMGWR